MLILRFNSRKYSFPTICQVFVNFISLLYLLIYFYFLNSWFTLHNKQVSFRDERRKQRFGNIEFLWINNKLVNVLRTFCLCIYLMLVKLEFVSIQIVNYNLQALHWFIQFTYHWIVKYPTITYRPLHRNINLFAFKSHLI